MEIFNLFLVVASLLLRKRLKNTWKGEDGMCYSSFCLSQVRTGYFEGRNRIDSLVADISYWGANAVTIHGRSRQQRYSKLADWDYIYQCARKAPDALQVLGNGDIFSYVDWNNHSSNCPELSTCMIARGALIKVIFSKQNSIFVFGSAASLFCLEILM